MKRLRVAFFIPTLSGGGAERATATIAAALDQSVFDPVLLLERGGPKVYPTGPGVRVVSLGLTRSRQTLVPLVRFLRHERPDVLYSALPHLNILATVARKVAAPRLPIVVSVHSNQDRELDSVRNGRLMRTVMPWVYRSADAIVAVSDGIADELRPIVDPSEKMRTIHNPIDVDQVERLAEAGIDHPWFDGQHQVISAMGRLSPEKDFASLIRAFSLVVKERPMARLLILGEGGQAEELAALAQALGIGEAIELPGFRENPFAYISRSACFVLSSTWEGFGMAIVEAMASGTAVLSTDCAHGPAEILRNGVFGLLARPGSIEDLAAGMFRLIDDQALRSGLVEAGMQRARDFDIAAVAPRYAELLLQVAAGASRDAGGRS
ncbi:MAG: glycosyltransferase [Chloroflexi bacterium]|nr:glycosyltransferase [Chloroflexota bacterium]